MAKVETCPEFWEQLKHHEGSRRDKVGRHIAYRCPAGKLTIGWGHNLEAHPIPNDWFSDGQPPKVGSVITNDTAMDILRKDVADCAKSMDLYMYWWRTLSEPRQAVLLNMCFNMGFGKLRGFTKTLEAVRRGKWGEAVYGMENSLWYKQVGQRSRALVLQMYTGKWVDKNGKVVEEEAKDVSQS